MQGDFATHYNNVKTGVYDGLIAFTTGVYPIKIHEVAPYMTKVNLGSMSIGAITINKKLFDSMSPETQKIFRDVGVEYSQRVSATMQKSPACSRRKWRTKARRSRSSRRPNARNGRRPCPTSPRTGSSATKQRGVPAKKVLEAYMAKLRAANVELVRDWDKE